MFLQFHLNFPHRLTIAKRNKIDVRGVLKFREGATLDVAAEAILLEDHGEALLSGSPV